MRTYLLPAAVLAAVALAGCASSEAPSPATALPSAAPPSSSAAAAPASTLPVQDAAVPPLTGDPTDLTVATQAGAGTGAEPTTLATADIVTGTGPAATPADTVAVRYTGTLWSDGSVFDSSWQRGDAPIEFPLDQVIPGFTQGIEGMAPGGRRVIVMPSDLAYGDNPGGGRPAGPLVFVVDLVSIS